MRLRNLTVAVAAATSLLALAPAGAAAHKHPNPSGRCNVNINVAPSRITAGDSILVWGQLRCRGRASAAGQTVQLYEHTHGTPGYPPVQSTTTNARGFYEMTTSPLEYNSIVYVRAHGAASGRRRVKVEAQVTFNGPPEGTQLLTGAPNKVTFTGAVNPADVGAQVILQRQNAETGNVWHWIGFGTVGQGGAYSIEHTFVVPGDANLRVLVRTQGETAESLSDVLTYEISQAQNSELTIEASSDPITFEQSVTISGLADGAGGKPVTLLSHTARQHGFAPIAEVTANASGNYTFPAQAPVNSTFYKVKSAGKVSAVLYEGVQDVLTAQVSPSTTVQAGQTLTFSGTVAPEHTGHIIYLERQNASGNGFHVVQTGLVGAGSAYSITHTVYVPGTKVFRVRIPGGPENNGAISTPFTITVTPAPAAALTPELSGNASLPSAGSESGYEGSEGSEGGSEHGRR